jgi:hypothetical protein
MAVWNILEFLKKVCGSFRKFHDRSKSFYIKRLGMFPFKVQLFQGCKSETEPINTNHIVDFTTHSSAVCIWYQVLLADITKCFEPNTVCKSQGQTFDKICLYLPKPVFSREQLYVALSRVWSLGSRSVVSEMNEIVNCVYKEIYE